MVYGSGFQKSILAAESFFFFFLQKKFYLELQHGKQRVGGVPSTFLFPFQLRGEVGGKE